MIAIEDGLWLFGTDIGLCLIGGPGSLGRSNLEVDCFGPFTNPEWGF